MHQPLLQERDAVPGQAVLARQFHTFVGLHGIRSCNLQGPVRCPVISSVFEQQCQIMCELHSLLARLDEADHSIVSNGRRSFDLRSKPVYRPILRFMIFSGGGEEIEYIL